MKAHVYRRVVWPTVGIGLVIAGHSFFLASLFPSLQQVKIFGHLHLRMEPSAAVAALGLLVAGVALARGISAEQVDRWLGWIDRRAVWVALAVVVTLAVGSLTVYHGHPLSMDEYSVSFQARLFGAGKIWAEYQPDLLERLIPTKFQRHFFGTDLETGRVVSSYWPGYALLMAPFSRLGAPWLLNPLLVAAALLLLRHLARELFPESRAGAWALLLALASPQLTAYGLSFYSMNAHLVANLAFAALLLRPTFRRAFAAGLVGSVALVLHQPLPHPFFALPWILWLACRRDRLPLLTGLALGYLPLTALLGVGWGGLVSAFRSTSDAIVSAAPAPTLPIGNEIPLVRSAATALSRGLGLLAVPGKGLLWDRLLEVEKLFLWAVPTLPLLAFWGWRSHRRERPVQLLAFSAVTTFVGYLFVPLNQGHGWGFRYFHQAWGVLPLLAAGAVVTYGREHPEWKRLVFALAVLSLAVATPHRFAQMHDYIGEHLAQRPPAEPEGTQIRFINFSRPYYREDLIQNDPLLRDPVLEMVSFGRESDEAFMRESFPRAVLVYDDGVDTVWRLE